MKPVTVITIAGCTVTALALGWSLWRSSEADAAIAAAAAARSELSRLGAPDSAQVSRAEDLAKQQQAALAEAAVLAPALPEAYRATDLASAAKRVRDDLEALRLRADRLGISLPKPLPFEGGLDSDGDVRAVQLVFLSEIRTVVDRSLDAGVSTIGQIDTSRAWSDPSGSFACFAINLVTDGSPSAIQALVSGFQQSTAQGLGLAKLAIDPSKDGSSQHLTATVTLLTPNQPEWKLQPEIPAKAPAGKSAKGLGARP